MEELLRPAHSANKIQSNIDKFESLSLNDATTIRLSSSKSKRSILDITSTGSESTEHSLDLKPSISSSHTSVSAKPSYKTHKRYDSTAFLKKSYLDASAPATLPEDAREILRSQPESEDLLAVLQYLQYGIERKHDFNIHVAGPQASQIIGAIVTKIIPDYWPIYQQGEVSKSELQIKLLILNVLRSVPGIGALLLQLRQFSSERTENNEVAQITVSALGSVLRSSSTLQMLLEDTMTLYTKQSMRRAVWQEAVAMFAGSKVLSTAAQAIVPAGTSDQKDIMFLADGSQYVQWLARNISAVIVKLGPPESASWTMISQVTKRGLNLGYRDAFVSELYSTLLLGPKALWTPLKQLVEALSSAEQRVFFDAMLRDLTRKYLRTANTVDSTPLNGLESDNAIGGVAAMITGLVEGNAVLDEHLVQWLTSTNGEYATLGLDTRRAVIATLALRKEKLHQVLEKCLDTFGDKIQIQHSPILQQETLAVTILIVVGYLHRVDPKLVTSVSRQGVFLQMTSNRLGASAPRARIIGMIVATAISRLVDSPDKAMSFGIEELEDESAQKWFSLVDTEDNVGGIKHLRFKEDKPVIEINDSPPKKRKPNLKKPTKPPPLATSKIISIEEVNSDQDSEDDPSLIPYAKPDSDASDSDDDPTLIDRTKPAAPIYITSLISQLTLTDKPDTVLLALRSAPALIRRKANFGTELSENVTPLASALINLREGMHNEETHHLRLSSLIACFISNPKTIGPWAAALYFDGDMALDQRASLLSMLGLGARELAGYTDPLNPPPSTSPQTYQQHQQPLFPSQRLPSHLAALYGSHTDTIASQITHSTIRPMALAAADKATGPDVLKIRTFSSRMEVEKKRNAKQAERTKRVPRDLHRILAEAVYLPLCCRLSLVLESSSVGGGGGGGMLGRSNVFEPGIIKLFLQTLTVVLVCLGPNALQLGDVTRETLVLLTRMHDLPRLVADPVVLPAVLQVLLMVVDLNVAAGVVSEERLITEFGVMVAELVRWAGRLEGVGVGGDGGEGEGEGMAWNVLVAGIQVKWQEVGRKYQGRMLGLMGGEMDEF